MNTKQAKILQSALGTKVPTEIPDKTTKSPLGAGLEPQRPIILRVGNYIFNMTHIAAITPVQLPTKEMAVIARFVDENRLPMYIEGEQAKVLLGFLSQDVHLL